MSNNTNNNGNWNKNATTTTANCKGNCSGNGGSNNTGTNTSSNAGNELIAAIDAARAKGGQVKVIRKQKHDPSNFYMTLSDGKQVGPINVQGNPDELNRKFGAAQSYLAGTKGKSPAKATA
jgi:hypothetical protein